MYSAFERLTRLSSFWSSALLVTIVLITVSNYLQPRPDPNVKLSVNRVQLRRGTEDYYVYKSTWLADLNFDIEGDFSKLFHWNTKLLFFYLVLEYPTAKNPRNRLTIWDKIVRARDFHRLDLQGIRAKYPPCDMDDKLPGSEAKLKLYWNTVPHIGILTDTQVGETSVTIPNVNYN